MGTLAEQLRRTGRACGSMLAAVVMLTATTAQSADKRVQDGRAAAPPLDVKGMERRLRGSDAEAVMAALAEARDAGAAAAAVAPAIEDLLRRGATPPIMRSSLEALGALGQASSSAAIRPYVQHRAPEIRREAARALSATKGAEAVAALRDALRSGDGMVRGLAAAGLGILGAREALPDLFTALDRDVPEAAPAIGQLCDPEACRRLLDRLGTIGFDVITSGLDPVLLRPLPEELLLAVVTRVRDLGTREAGRYLVEVSARWPASGSPRVKAALEAAADAIPGARQ